MNKKTGDPAFPVKKWREEGHYECMSLRDWFAGMALQGFLAGNPDADCGFEGYAHDAYKTADAMIARREAKS